MLRKIGSLKAGDVITFEIGFYDAGFRRTAYYMQVWRREKKSAVFQQLSLQHHGDDSKKIHYTVDRSKFDSLEFASLIATLTGLTARKITDPSYFDFNHHSRISERDFSAFIFEAAL